MTDQPGRSILAAVQGKTVSVETLTAQAVALAGELLTAAQAQQTDRSCGRRELSWVGEYERLRHLGQPSATLLRAAHAAHVPHLRDPVTRNGRLELRYYLREQSVTETLHRYGNIMPKPKARE